MFRCKNTALFQTGKNSQKEPGNAKTQKIGKNTKTHSNRVVFCNLGQIGKTGHYLCKVSYELLWGLYRKQSQNAEMSQNHLKTGGASRADCVPNMSHRGHRLLYAHARNHESTREKTAGQIPDGTFCALNRPDRPRIIIFKTEKLGEFGAKKPRRAVKF